MTVALDHPVYSTVYNVRSLKRFYARNVHFVGTTDNRENSKKPVEKKTCKKVHSCQCLCSLRYILGPEVKRADCSARKILNSDSSEVIIDKVFDAQTPQHVQCENTSPQKSQAIRKYISATWQIKSLKRNPYHKACPSLSPNIKPLLNPKILI